MKIGKFLANFKTKAKIEELAQTPWNMEMVVIKDCLKNTVHICLPEQSKN